MRDTTERRTLLGGTVATVLAGAGLAAAGTAGTAAASDNGQRADREGRPGPRIGIFLFDGFSLLDPTGPAEVLCRLPGASVTMIGLRRGPVRTDTAGVAVVADLAFDEVDRLDVLLVPGGADRGMLATIGNPAVLDWIRRLHRRTRWTTSVCTGSVLLAAAGLLEGRRATTYWAAAEYLESTYGVTYVPERWVRSGKIMTAAGVSAGIDMALALAAELAGEEVARAVQLAVEYDPSPPFDSGDAAEADPALKELALRLIAESQV
ncbi:DJ-1/PfpI family protein [Streptomyces sp. NPDC049881]|uniref:DJ-1/PfpI family protein n=1 Tax=Streptomyces sp. NPDC049881 TaxID=3155778 RepID=UPI0034400A3F